MSETDWNDAFACSPYIENGADYFDYWPKKSATFRETWTAKQLDQPYGKHPRLTYDLFEPQGEPKGLFIFVHGGYWKSTDKSYWSFLAEGALARGWQVALPQYILAPDATIPEITKQIGTAITHLSALSNRAIVLAGHSAGGHLVSRMACENAPVSKSVMNRITKIVSISGLYDLSPLIKTEMNVDLQLTEGTAVDESTAFLMPNGTPITAWTGGSERPEFLRQARILADNWEHADIVIDEGKHHFDVIEGLLDVDGPLLNEILKP